MSKRKVRMKHVDDLIFIELVKKYSSEKKPLTYSKILELMNGDEKKGIAPVKEAKGYKIGRHALSERMRTLVQYKKEDVIDAIKNKEFDKDDFRHPLSDGYILYTLDKNLNPNGYWYESKKKIDDYEMRYLIDSVIYSKVLTKEQKNSLLRHILSMPQIDKSVRDAIKHKEYMNVHTKLFVDTDVIKNLSIIQEAIEKNKKISFELFVYEFKDNGIKSTICYDSTKKGGTNLRTVSPHEIVMSEGRYYLLATREIEGVNINRTYRIDLMYDIEIDSFHNAVAKPKDYTTENISKYVMQNPYIYSGKTEKVVFRIKADQFTQFVDKFGMNYKSISVVDSDLEITIDVNTKAFSFWAMQYADIVTVLKPETLRDDIIKCMEETIRRYKEYSKMKEDNGS